MGQPAIPAGLYPTFSYFSMLGQTVLAWWAPLLLLLVISSQLGLGEGTRSEIIQYLIVGILGASLACSVRTVAPGLITEGVWVWVLPAIIEVAAVSWETALSGAAGAWHGFFISRGPGHGEESWGIVLLTLPTIGCGAYSLAMAWSERQTGKQTANAE